MTDYAWLRRMTSLLFIIHEPDDAAIAARAMRDK
jgi:hypothetical protein